LTFIGVIFKSHATIFQLVIQLYNIYTKFTKETTWTSPRHNSHSSKERKIRSKYGVGGILLEGGRCVLSRTQNPALVSLLLSSVNSSILCNSNSPPLASSSSAIGVGHLGRSVAGTGTSLIGANEEMGVGMCSLTGLGLASALGLVTGL